MEGREREKGCELCEEISCDQRILKRSFYDIAPKCRSKIDKIKEITVIATLVWPVVAFSRSTQKTTLEISSNQPFSR